MKRCYVTLAALGLSGLPIGAAHADAGLVQGISPKAEALRAGRAETLTRLKTWRGADPRAKSVAACQANQRPTYDDELTYDDDTYGFRIHYTLGSSDDRYVTEADVTRTAEVMRFVMDAEGEGLGYNMPPDDTIDAEYHCDEGFGGNGGNGYYDVYFVNDNGIYGYAQPMTLTSNGSIRATSFLALSTWILENPGELEVTVAHEFFHAVQFGYDVFDEAFWMENSAVWMEEEVYDEVNDYYNYLSYTFDHPEKPLSTEAIYMYAHGLWPIYMTEQLDADVIREIWETCATDGDPNAFEAQQSVLDGVYPGGWAAAVIDFRGAQYNKAEFSEGADYPSLKASELVSSYPVEGQATVENTGAEVVIFPSTSAGVTDDTLNICFKGASDAIRARVYARQKSDRTVVPLALTTSDSDGCVSIERFGATYDQAALIGSFGQVASATGALSYAACVGDTVCEAPEPGAVVTPTPTAEEDDEDVVLCGGCIVLESDEASGRQTANLLLFGLHLFAGIFFLRRRTRS